MRFDTLAILVVIADLCTGIFLIWRAAAKKSNLWETDKFIYWYIALMTLYHGTIYLISMFIPIPEIEFIHAYLHPIIVLYMINPILIAIIHWRGGRII